MKTTPSAPDLLASKRPLVIGHRGYCAIAPENTLPSFELAIEAGADVVELDYHHSKDGVPVVIHDATLNRTTDARRKRRWSRLKVAHHTAAEIRTLDAGRWFDPSFAGTWVPSLDEALEFICEQGGRVALIEHKSGDAATCVHLLREKNLINKVVVISFDWKFLRAFHELEPAQVLGALGPPGRITRRHRPSRISGRLNRRWLDELVRTGARLVVWNRQVPRPAIELAHHRGLKVWVYTINEPARARELIERGVNGIITNDVFLVQQAPP